MDENEKLAIKYKFLRAKIVEHYQRGCKMLNVVKLIVAFLFLLYTGIGLGYCHRGGSIATWLCWWIAIIFLEVFVFLITDYCKFLISSKVIPYLEDDDLLEFGEYDIFLDDDDDEDEEENESEDDE